VAKPQTIETPKHERTISREEMLARLRDRALVIVNVLPKETFADGHIPGSMNLPLAEIESRARQVISNLGQEIAVYCTGPT
jgi:ArsR family transcriptional regulator